MGKFFSQEVLIKDTVGGRLLKAIISSFLYTFIIYYCCVSGIVEIFAKLIEENGTGIALILCIWFLPFIIVLTIVINLGQSIIYIDSKKKKKNRK